MSGALVGRHAELQLLVEALKAARSGGSRTVILRGEPGIGKSRLLAEAVTQAELLGHIVLESRLDELDRYLPYAALRAAIWSALAAERDPGLEAAVATAQAGLGAALAVDAAAPVPLRRVFDAVEQLLRAWSGRHPTVLAIDDLHVADADTLTVLALLMRHLRSAPVTFLATMRVHPPDVSVDLASAVDRLDRDGLATVIDVGPLDVEDVRAVARSVLAVTPDDRLVDALWDASKGNPFYVEEGSRSLLAAGRLVVDDTGCHLADPDTTPTLGGRSALLYRLYNLGPEARAVAPLSCPPSGGSGSTSSTSWPSSPTSIPAPSTPHSTRSCRRTCCALPTTATTSPTRSYGSRCTTTSGPRNAAGSTPASPRTCSRNGPQA